MVLGAAVITALPLHLEAQPLAAGTERFLGCGTSSSLFRNLADYWNQVTPGNDGKWGSVEPVQGQYNWSGLDVIYNYAVTSAIPFKEHVLVWGNQQPSWIGSLDSAAQRAAVENWMQRVGQRYPATAYVDVVNEPFNAPPSYAAALGGAGTTGWDWVISAFELARQFCPSGAKLIVNEYNVLQSSAITTNYLSLVALLKERDLLDGIGVQGHYFEFRSDIGSTNPYVYDLETLKGNLKRLTDTGIPVYITEFDIDEPVDSNQLAQYKIYFPIVWENPGVRGITFWGYIEGDVWNAHPNTYLLHADGSERPALQWLRTFVRIPLPPSPLSPVYETDVPRNPQLVWSSSDSATSYHVQLATSSAFSPAAVDTVVADTLVRLSDPLESSRRIFWRVSAVNEHGESRYSTTVSFITGTHIVSVEGSEGVQPQLELLQNYPNPFNSMTQVKYSVSEPLHVSLRVFDVLGTEIASLHDGMRHPGLYTVTFDGTQYASGVYFVVMKAGGTVLSRKLVLAK